MLVLLLDESMNWKFAVEAGGAVSAPLGTGACSTAASRRVKRVDKASSSSDEGGED